MTPFFRLPRCTAPSHSHKLGRGMCPRTWSSGGGGGGAQGGGLMTPRGDAPLPLWTEGVALASAHSQGSGFLEAGAGLPLLPGHGREGPATGEEAAPSAGWAWRPGWAVTAGSGTCPATPLVGVGAAEGGFEFGKRTPAPDPTPLGPRCSSLVSAAQRGAVPWPGSHSWPGAAWES